MLLWNGFLVRRPATLLFWLVTLFLLCCVSMIFSLTLLARAASAAENTYISKSARSASTLNCPDAKPLASTAPPSLNFCSPIYNGTIEGSYSSYIVLVGENFSAMPKLWLLTSNKSLIPTAAQSCLTQQTSACDTLPLPQTQQIRSIGTLFSWIWSGSKFPTSKGKYYFVAVFDPPITPSTVETSSVQQNGQPAAFSLLSSQSPCITLNSSNSVACIQQQHITLSAGSTFTVDGANWLPGGNTQNVVITAICAVSSQCTPNQLFQYTSQPDVHGIFHLQETLPTNITGTYNICATNQVQPKAILGVDTNTVANGSLTFGCVANADTLQLTISPTRITPAPVSTQALNKQESNPQFGSIFDYLSFVLALPMVAAVILYLAARRTGTAKTATNNEKTNGTGASVMGTNNPLSPATGTSAQPIPGQLPIPQQPIPSGTQQGTKVPLQKRYLLTNVYLQNARSSVQNMPKVVESITPDDLKKIGVATQNLIKGKPENAIHLAQIALLRHPLLWEKLRESIVEVQTTTYPQNLEQQTFSLLEKVLSAEKALSAPSNKNFVIDWCIDALVRYLWELNRWRLDKSLYGLQHTADIQYNMGIAYSILAVTVPQQIGQAHALSALSCFEIALNYYQGNNFMLEQAHALHNIGNIYLNTNLILGIDKVRVLENAIKKYYGVLQICTPERFSIVPEVWIATKYHLGKAYSSIPLPPGERSANLHFALQHYQEAYKTCISLNLPNPPTKELQTWSVKIKVDMTTVENELRIMTPGGGH